MRFFRHTDPIVFLLLTASFGLLLMGLFAVATKPSNAAGVDGTALNHTVIYKNSVEPRVVGSPKIGRVAAVECQVTREQFQNSVASVAATWKYLEGEEAEKFLKVFNAWGTPTNFVADLIGFGFNSSGQIVGVALFKDGCTVNATALKPDAYRMLMEKALGRVVGNLFGLNLPGGGTGV